MPAQNSSVQVTAYGSLRRKKCRRNRLLASSNLKDLLMSTRARRYALPVLLEHLMTDWGSHR
eukprot:6171916-Pleurochrysis_carterae.AAC.3